MSVHSRIPSCTPSQVELFMHTWSHPCTPVHTDLSSHAHANASVHAYMDLSLRDDARRPIPTPPSPLAAWHQQQEKQLGGAGISRMPWGFSSSSCPGMPLFLPCSHLLALTALSSIQGTQEPCNLHPARCSGGHPVPNSLQPSAWQKFLTRAFFLQEILQENFWHG